MNLWIRSQDKRLLINVKDLVINGNFDFKSNKYDYDILANELTVASYKKEERAIEVLNEIQNKIIHQYLVKPSTIMHPKDIDQEEKRLKFKYDRDFIMQDNGFEIYPINTNIIIYEMPKE